MSNRGILPGVRRIAGAYLTKLWSEAGYLFAPSCATVRSATIMCPEKKGEGALHGLVGFLRARQNVILRQAGACVGHLPQTCFLYPLRFSLKMAGGTPPFDSPFLSSVHCKVLYECCHVFTERCVDTYVEAFDWGGSSSLYIVVLVCFIRSFPAASPFPW